MTEERDPRENLILEATRFAKIMRPTLIMFENVPGLRREQFSSILQDIRSGLSQLGYEVGDPISVDAADYGVPQRRLRCLLFAKRNGCPPPIPAPTTPSGHRITVRHTIFGLPRLASGEVSLEDLLHFARTHSSITLERLAHIPRDGGGRKNLPTRLELTCHKDHRGHPDVYGRMSWDDVAPTLTTGCTDLTKGRFAHPDDDRAITLREAARLQTFPDTYKFFGSAKQIASQIGNAVPVRLVEALASTLRTGIFS